MDQAIESACSFWSSLGPSKMADSDSSGTSASSEDKLKWTQELVQEMIRLRGEFTEDFTGKRGTGQQGWMKVARHLGHPNEWKVIQKKWFNMVVKYKEIKTPRSGMSTEDGNIGPITWQYFDSMDAILGDRHIINPPYLIDTSHSSTFSTSPSPSPPANCPSSSSSPPIDFANYVFLSSPTNLPQITTPTTPKVSLYKSNYLGGTPSGSGAAKRRNSNEDGATHGSKKEKEDPYLKFLLEERRIAAEERKEEEKRRVTELESKENFQNKMLALLGKFFDKP